MKVFNFILGESFKIQFLAIFLLISKRNLIDFEIMIACFLIKVLNLIGEIFEIHVLAVS